MDREPVEMDTEPKHCLICRGTVRCELINPPRVGSAGPADAFLYKIRCRNCPEYVVVEQDTEECIADMERKDSLIRKRFARYFYEHPGLSNILITPQPETEEGYTVLDIESATNWYRDVVSPSQTYERTLLNLRNRSNVFGEVFNSVDDRWLIPTMKDDEADAIIGLLFREGFVIGTQAWDRDEFSLTLDGFRHADELEGRGIPSSQPFPASGETIRPSESMPKVFLSHSHLDKRFVERLATDLYRVGVDVWYDGWDLDIGHDLTVKIQEGIRQSDYLAVILSPAAVRSPWVEKEWTTALNRELEERNVVVLPVLYQDCEMPPFLQGKVYADFRRSGEYGERLSDLMRCLRGESKRPPKQ